MLPTVQEEEQQPTVGFGYGMGKAGDVERSNKRRRIDILEQQPRRYVHPSYQWKSKTVRTLTCNPDSSRPPLPQVPLKDLNISNILSPHTISNLPVPCLADSALQRPRLFHDWGHRHKHLCGALGEDRRALWGLDIWQMKWMQMVLMLSHAWSKILRRSNEKRMCTDGMLWLLCFTERTDMTQRTLRQIVARLRKDLEQSYLINTNEASTPNHCKRNNRKCLSLSDRNQVLLRG